MLGHLVARYLAERGGEVTTSNERYAGLPRDPLIEAVRDSKCEWVINAIGKIKQKCESPAELLLTNGILPHHLNSRLHPHQRLVHASSDCVFSGKRGSYGLNDERDAEDAYGLSKILAEGIACDARGVVIRTSIIGPELGTGSGLMGWFLGQTNEVDGFTNHRWNGITTLEWAKLCLEVICGEHSQSGNVLQPGVEPAVSKYELLRLIANTWDHHINIVPVNAAAAIDRTLLPTILRSGLDEQLAEMKEWYSKP